MDDGQIYVSLEKRRMSVLGYEQTSSRPQSMSALPPKADILATIADFRF